MKAHLLAHRAMYGILGTLLSISIAIIYYFVVPEISPQASTLTRLILTYGHSLCWLLLSIASLSFALKAPPKVTTAAAYAALITYAVFIITMYVS